MNYIITGGTGFVGRQLTNFLTAKGHHVYIITRSPDKYKATETIDYISYDIDPNILPEITGVINLAGESLFGYWTDEKKESILQSRLNVTEQVVSLMSKMDKKPAVFISGSAVGFYGTSEEHIYTEKTIQPGTDFLATVVTQWEDVASQAVKLGIRTVYTRFGIVLGKNAGSFPLMSLPVKLFVGGKIGDGEQWISWVHIDDVIGLIAHALNDDKIAGPLNVTAPNPVRNKDFYKQLATVLRRPYWFTTPKSAMKIALGEMSELITKGQYVEPKKALDSNYTFHYPKIKKALNDVT